MIKSILRPSFIFAFIGILLIGGFVYLSYFSGKTEIYVNQSANVASSNWRDSLKSLSANSIKENISPAENLGEQPNLTNALISSLTNALGPRILDGGGLSNIPKGDLEAAAKYLPEARVLLEPINKFSSSDLKIIDNNDPSAIKEYYNSVAQVYLETLSKIKKSDFEIIYETFALGKSEELLKMKDIVNAQDIALTKILEIPVPKDATQFAVREINYLSTTKRIMEIFSAGNEDPIKVLSVLKFRMALLEEIKKFHIETGKNLKASGIDFTNKDAAKILFE